jgi:hypothetical protein
MYSLLQKKPKVITDPYPHIIIEDALPWDLYDELEKTFPEEQVLNTIPFDKGICYRMKSDILVHPTFQPDVWRKFSEYHTSAEWFMEVYELFKPWLSHPKVTDLLPNLEDNVCARGWRGFKEIKEVVLTSSGRKKRVRNPKNILTDCQVVMHNPSLEIQTTRTPHIDNPLEMFAGLLYMPYKDDTSTGGEFQIHSTKNNITKVDMKGGREIYPEDVGPVHTTVPYKKNTFVMFCNMSPNTVHSVSKRINPTMHRRSVNIIAEFRKKFKNIYHKMYEVEEITLFSKNNKAIKRNR